jgi:tetratricopeptide (TPR) repeat protein
MLDQKESIVLGQPYTTTSAENHTQWSVKVGRNTTPSQEATRKVEPAGFTPNQLIETFKEEFVSLHFTNTPDKDESATDIQQILNFAGEYLPQFDKQYTSRFSTNFFSTALGAYIYQTHHNARLAALCVEKSLMDYDHDREDTVNGVSVSDEVFFAENYITLLGIVLAENSADNGQLAQITPWLQKRVNRVGFAAECLEQNLPRYQDESSEGAKAMAGRIAIALEKAEKITQQIENPAVSEQTAEVTTPRTEMSLGEDNQSNPEFQNKIGIQLAREGRLTEAVICFERALNLISVLPGEERQQWFLPSINYRYNLVSSLHSYTRRQHTPPSFNEALLFSRQRKALIEQTRADLPEITAELTEEELRHYPNLPAILEQMGQMSASISQFNKSHFRHGPVDESEFADKLYYELTCLKDYVASSSRFVIKALDRITLGTKVFLHAVCSDPNNYNH